ARGAYIKAEAVGGAPEVILIATGSEVSLIMAAHKMLNEMGIRARAVSMPSFELFEAQDEGYKESVLPSSVTARVAVEAGVPFGWHRYVGTRGKIIALERFGASAPQEVVFRELGLTAEAVVAAARELLGR
ncbi:MAG: transketolase, partial [Candidatus Thermofonsia Clade 1 bacterium]